MSDISGFSEQGDQGWSNANPNDIRQIEYGKSEDDIQNRFALSVNYELQYGKEFTGIKKASRLRMADQYDPGLAERKALLDHQQRFGADQAIEADGLMHGYNNRAVPAKLQYSPIGLIKLGIPG